MIQDTKHKELIIAWLNGAKLEYLNFSQEWCDAITPNWNELNSYRIKPTLRTVDMSVLIGADIDCTFGKRQTIGALHSIVGGSFNRKLSDHSYDSWTSCTPRLDHWMPWNEGDCPLPEGVLVIPRLRNALWDTRAMQATYLMWDIQKEPVAEDIIAFKVVGLAKGWQWSTISTENKQGDLE
jgi:hypothetical protein